MNGKTVPAGMTREPEDLPIREKERKPMATVAVSVRIYGQFSGGAFSCAIAGRATEGEELYDIIKGNTLVH